MRHFFILYILTSISIQLVAQKNITAMIAAENSFAAASRANGTKFAFLHFLDSTGIVFSQGKAVNGLEFWNQSPENSAVLDWQPRYAAIASSGDFGFTTGPWTFQPSKEDSVVARGYYTTIWHTNKKGEWKFLVDLGVNNTPVENLQKAINYWPDIKNRNNSTNASMLDAEKNFINSEGASTGNAGQRKKLYTGSLAAFFIVHRHRQLPAKDVNALSETMKSMPEKIEYTILGSNISSSGDIGYVYGTTLINSKTDNYLRIWKKEQAGWKIALEVLRF